MRFNVLATHRCLRFVLACATLLTALLVLASCSSPTTQYVGMWRLDSCEMDGKTYDRTDIVELMESEGNYTLLGIAEDGSWAAGTNDTWMAGTWSAESGSLTFTDITTDDPIDVSFDESVITMDFGDVVMHFTRESETIPSEQDYTGSWEIGWGDSKGQTDPLSGRSIKPTYDSMEFNSDGTCELVSDLDFMSASGTWKYACGICHYTISLDEDPSEKYAGSFSGDEFVLAGPVNYTVSNHTMAEEDTTQDDSDVKVANAGFADAMAE